MDAFEQLIADLFWAGGYWVRTNLKVDLTREDKQRIGLPSCPRWEVDLIAFKPGTGELLAVECKSYLDSRGVDAADFLPGAKLKGRYKLFHDATLRATVLGRLQAQLAGQGLCPPTAVPVLALAYGNATRSAPARLAELFAAEGWRLFGPGWIAAGLSGVAKAGYENSTASVVAKLLARTQAEEGAPEAPRRRGTAPAAGAVA